MEYVQLTLNDWLDMKDRLKRQLLDLKRGYVRAGYYLRRMEESKGYETEGYKSLAEFAEKECGMKASTVSRLMAINRAYSIDGYSELLLPEYEDFNKSQLEEMLQLPDKDREMITPETKRETIRELQRFNKAEAVTGVADTEHEVIQCFFNENRNVLEELYESDAWQQSDLDEMKDLVNPSGARSYRKGLFFMAMTDREVKIKKFGGNPEPMSWERFFEITKEIFGETLQSEEVIEAEQETEVEEIAPAQIVKSPVNTEADKDSKKEESNEDEAAERTVRNEDSQTDERGHDTSKEQRGTPEADEAGAARKEKIKNERNDKPIDRDGSDSGEDRGDKAAVKDPESDEGREPEAGEPSGTGDSGTADPGEETAAEEPARGKAERNNDAGSPERRAEGKAGASEKKTEQSEEQDLQESMNAPEHVEAEVVIEEIMKKTEILYLLQRTEDFVKTAQWEMAEEKAVEMLKGIRSRKNGGYVQE